MDSTYDHSTSLGLDLNLDLFRHVDKTPANGDLTDELKRINTENKKLTEMLSIMYENYKALQVQLIELMSKPSNNDIDKSRKRKAEGGSGSNQNSSSSDESLKNSIREDNFKRSKISRVFVRTKECDTSLVVKDGYQWRKYGQKVTRDNPSPRAYFKCSFAPSCLVKKKVQRSVDDRSILIATYEGEHNHMQPSHTTNQAPTSANSPLRPNVTLDLMKTMPFLDEKLEKPGLYHHFLVEQMASTLTRDPSFKAALATAISNRVV